MKHSRKVVASAIAAALAGGGLLLASAPAMAASPGAAWEPDPQVTTAGTGPIAFYDAAGHQITSGNNLNNLFAYAAATTATPRTGTTKAFVEYAFPDHSQPTSSWHVTSASASTAYPNAAAPAPVNGITFPVSSATTANQVANLAPLLGGGTNDTTAGYNHVIQVRLFDIGGPTFTGADSATYWASDILYNTTTNSWSELYPVDVNVTSTTLTATPGTQGAGSAVALKATETSASGTPVAGNVQFLDGTTVLDTQPVNTTTGIATSSTSTLAVGPHNLSAVFTPTDTTNNSSSTGTATETITGPPTTTTLVVPTPVTASTSVTFTATVKDNGTNAGVTTGSVNFFDGPTTGTPIGSVATPAAGGVFAFTDTAGLAAGQHTINAVYVPSNPSVEAASQASQGPFNVGAAQSPVCQQTGSSCTDKQDIDGVIPVGTLTITTPYNGVAGPAPAGVTQGTDPNLPNSTPGYFNGALNLGTLALNTSDTEFSASAPFQDITVTDNRSGGAGWTIQAQSSDLNDGGSDAVHSFIDSQDVGLTALTGTAGTGFTSTVATFANPAADPAYAPGAALGGPSGTGNQGLGLAPHAVATVNGAGSGEGSYTLNGTLTLNAPTSTEAGVFTGTITFTVS